MASIQSFKPIADPGARLLILGSMPGEASLAARQYYAHPRNAFWPIMGGLLGFDPLAHYAKRVQALQRAQIALWDVLKSCVREGSLDSRIDRDTLVPNDFRRFFHAYPGITRVCFNGAMAEATFRRHVLPSFDASRVELVRLPSTSPAHASLSFEQKLEAWRAMVSIA